jgi:signal transduction histidine kinase
VIAALLVAGWSATMILSVVLARWRRRLALVARAEHELRGPAAVLVLACERMRREPAARRHARALEVELERLRAALSELTAARTGRRQPARRGPVELGDFAAAAAAGWSGALGTTGRRVRLDWRAGRVDLRADRGRLASVLGNLVANAAEHGDGPMELLGRRIAGGVRVEVRNGVGGAARPAEARTPGGRWARARDGRGLGLRIAHEATRELGGRLSLEAEAGSVTAALELPVANGDGFVQVARAEDLEPLAGGEGSGAASGAGSAPVAGGGGSEPASHGAGSGPVAGGGGSGAASGGTGSGPVAGDKGSGAASGGAGSGPVAAEGFEPPRAA